MLIQLQALHVELRESLRNLASSLRKVEPDHDAVSAARLKLAKIQRRRRSLIHSSILPQLRGAPDPAGTQIAALMLEDARVATELSTHIGRWTTSSIRADWASYQRASAHMRASVLRQMEREATVLYPLLEDMAGS